jgi:hypothetical protein
VNSRLVIAVIGAAALVFACGPRSHSETAVAAPGAPTTAATPRRAKNAKPDPLTAALRVSVDDEVRMAYEVTNTAGKQLEVRFPDGRTHDFVILDSLEREVWRWSEGRMFTQSLRNELLSDGDKLSYENEHPAAALHGRYTVVAELPSVNYPMETRAQFVVP